MCATIANEGLIAVGKVNDNENHIAAGRIFQPRLNGCVGRTRFDAPKLRLIVIHYAKLNFNTVLIGLSTNL